MGTCSGREPLILTGPTGLTATLYLGDCLEVLPLLAAGSIDAVVTDPPYFRVLDDDWDRQWSNRAEYLAWLGCNLQEYRRVLRANGSLWVFAFPDMAAYVEVEVARYFAVLNHIVWEKSNGGVASRSCKEELRSFLPLSERIIFAEQYGADSMALGESGYAAQCEHLRGFVFEPLRLYLRGEWERAGLNADDANAACNTASMAGRHFFTRSQWCLPTAEHYASLRRYAAEHGRVPAPPYEEYHAAPRYRFERADYEYLRADYEDLRADYEYLRADYEDLRADYEDLRRPFALTAADQYTDVWQFNTSSGEGTFHPAQKPLALLAYILEKSTRPQAVVLDPCGGSGTTAIACAQTGRHSIYIERDPAYFEIAVQRIKNALAQPRLL